MRWSFFTIATIATLIIWKWEWSKMKKKPAWDRGVFVSFLLLVWALSMFDLPNTPGPRTLLQFLYKPLKGLLEP
ncbi:hypothetical protein RAC89_29360 [Paenibacillus sp. GD4]|jgi:CDP-diglyceride synthetase|uniref:hypothetical protein n=1 Tax=Paenibacillus sp. GD4 TaxID=3068890 RepID=UPI002796DF79|nr:hypothetical protein [Paenibacillus sp. GD4]MDQ1914491.1 hypothetical protein [Paenibacillus sp. GD4]